MMLMRSVPMGGDKQRDQNDIIEASIQILSDR